MDTTSAIAIAGLGTATIGTLAVPWLQNYFTRRREEAARLDERRYAAYVDAITYAQYVEVRVNNLTTEPYYRGSRSYAPHPDEILIRAKLHLVAPVEVSHAFDGLVEAWESVAWNVNEVGPQGPDGEFFADKDQPDVVRLCAALEALKAAVRTKP
ncbi:hypothetical protein MINS_03350 [Mycolicibacterium insubricum]|uniref:hypothetical protein n=1 Tax=Mycolicibacterium insubricum TaxID=444597 RepID=UPI001055F27D|nr:hypothetical protein [Mycolicibacterium insubricum]MCV7082849.1 hypothetical protein [Mycolicibacterium insubricum]BBZ64906.1 hypothetical protein MINS_03350 [Mycolicibacterium insubricum]